MDRKQLMAWCPPGINPELAAVRVPKDSELTLGQWWTALADRVQSLVDKEPDPEAASEWAARALGVPAPWTAQGAWECLVEHNLELLTALKLQVLAHKDPFPAKVLIESAVDRQAIEQTDLQMWVELAAARVTASSLD